MFNVIGIYLDLKIYSFWGLNLKRKLVIVWIMILSWNVYFIIFINIIDFKEGLVFILFLKVIYIKKLNYVYGGVGKWI